MKIKTLKKISYTNIKYANICKNTHRKNDYH
jgi:hypothetical protein